jgi:hypothetical protein
VGTSARIQTLTPLGYKPIDSTVSLAFLFPNLPSLSSTYRSLPYFFKCRSISIINICYACGIRHNLSDEIQGFYLVLAGFQFRALCLLCFLTQASSPFCFSYFSDKISCFHPDQLQTPTLIFASMPPVYLGLQVCTTMLSPQ